MQKEKSFAKIVTEESNHNLEPTSRGVHRKLKNRTKPKIKSNQRKRPILFWFGLISFFNFRNRKNLNWFWFQEKKITEKTNQPD